jgi:hypothetical protein
MGAKYYTDMKGGCLFFDLGRAPVLDSSPPEEEQILFDAAVEQKIRSYPSVE